MTSRRETTYVVRIWKIERVARKHGSSHKVVWCVDRRRWSKTFRIERAADSFRSELVTAQRGGEAFDVGTGLPVSAFRARRESVSWYRFACEYADAKWPAASGTYRRGIAEALTAATMTLLPVVKDPVEARAVRSALTYWAFNKRRDTADQPAEVTRRLAWVARHSPRLVDLSDLATLRTVLDGMARTLAGKPAAGTTVNRRRAVLSNLLSRALEQQLIETNPVTTIRWKAPRVSHAVDRRSVINPAQARALLAAVRATPRSGPRLVAFFGCLYFAALRPEEAVNLQEASLQIPDEGWGWITIDRAAPDTGKAWTDTGQQRDERQLKHRAAGESRRVPCAPELTALLHEHVATFGTDAAGRIFRGEHGAALATITYSRLWDRARRSALTPLQYDSPLARRPYDLRHAAVSTWLNAGVPPTQIAEWAGHSVAVLHSTYAKCLDGQEATALALVADALREP